MAVRQTPVLCPLHRELDQAYAATEAAFRNVTLKHLLGSTARSFHCAKSRRGGDPSAFQMDLLCR